MGNWGPQIEGFGEGLAEKGWQRFGRRVGEGLLGNVRNTVPRVMFRQSELTDFLGKLGKFWEQLGEFVFALKY